MGMPAERIRCTRLFHDADSTGESLLGVALIGTKGHIDYHEGTLNGTDNGGCIDNHLVKSDWKGGFMPLHDVGGGVADKDNVNPCALKE